jgi:hypothetical protein
LLGEFKLFTTFYVNRVALRSLLCLSAAVCAPLAFGYVDAATKLGITVPAGFLATAGKAPEGQDAMILINAQDGKPTAVNSDKNLCALAYAKAPKNAALTQKQINDIVDKPEREQVVRTMFSSAFEVKKLERFTLKNAKGFSMIGMPKMGTNHEKIFVYVAMVETPKGRATLNCATTQEESAAATKLFDQLRSSVSAP